MSNEKDSELDGDQLCATELNRKSIEVPRKGKLQMGGTLQQCAIRLPQDYSFMLGESFRPGNDGWESNRRYCKCRRESGSRGAESTSRLLWR
jgi:hypothetical protein